MSWGLFPKSQLKAPARVFFLIFVHPLFLVISESATLGGALFLFNVLISIAPLLFGLTYDFLIASQFPGTEFGFAKLGQFGCPLPY